MSFFNSLIFLVFISSSYLGYSRGCGGFYTLKGTIYSEKNMALSNSEVEVSFGDSTFMMTTTINGNFEIKIPWLRPCLAHSPKFRKRHFENQHNPKKLILFVNRKVYVVKNKWRKYSECFDAEENTYNKDLTPKRNNFYRSYPFF